MGSCQRLCLRYVFNTTTRSTTRLCISYKQILFCSQFIEIAFAYKGINISWKGKGIDEIGYDAKTGKTYIEISEKYFRPAEVNELLGNATKAKNELNWEPKISFQRLVEEMVDSDCQ